MKLTSPALQLAQAELTRTQRLGLADALQSFVDFGDVRAPNSYNALEREAYLQGLEDGLEALVGTLRLDRNL